ncbi:MAG: riboflavin synthase [Austwickia sp.]|nr:riboflavin synthase [Actinomycetota bacterium]MCO5309342.1 riboflavin synthase [Austwickia sp.]
MFTGIVEELGRVERVERGPDSVVLHLHGPTVVADAAPGASIAVNGVCLTVTGHDTATFTVDVMQESLDRSSLGALQPGSPVNLERAMRADGRFGGHVVQGHVDATTTCLGRTPGENWEVVTFALPPALAPYVVAKGSITLDGVSLTVSRLGAQDFDVSLIPTTLAATTLGALPVGGLVNVEVDVIAKYVERLLAPRTTPEVPA